MKMTKKTKKRKKRKAHYLLMCPPRGLSPSRQPQPLLIVADPATRNPDLSRDTLPEKGSEAHAWASGHGRKS